MPMKRLALFVLILATAFGCMVREPSSRGRAEGQNPFPACPKRITKSAREFFPVQLCKKSLSDFQYHELAPGVEYASAHFSDLFGKTNDLYIVRIDFKQAEVEPAIHPRATSALGQPDGKIRRRTSEVAEEYRALLAVNGGFFTSEKLPCYIQKVNGKRMPGKGAHGSGLAFTGKEKLFIGPLDEQGLQDYENYICGDALLQDGHCSLPGQRHADDPAPRTLLGLAPGQVLVLLVIDGRQKDVSQGINYWEATDLLQWFGCRDGFALDGGGSTTLVIREEALAETPHTLRTTEMDPAAKVMNSPSDGIERKVIDHFLILDRHSVRPPAP